MNEIRWGFLAAWGIIALHAVCWTVGWLWPWEVTPPYGSAFVVNLFDGALLLFYGALIFSGVAKLGDILRRRFA